MCINHAFQAQLIHKNAYIHYIMLYSLYLLITISSGYCYLWDIFAQYGSGYPECETLSINLAQNKKDKKHGML